MRKPKFEIVAGKDGRIYFQLKAANGEIILAGRSFATKAEAVHSIASVMRYGQLEDCFVRRESIQGQYFFQVKSPSGRLIGWSNMYATKQAREIGIASVKKAAAFGRVFDLNA